MHPALLQLAPKVKTLLERLNNVANLDNVDAKVSTLAPSGTALSSATWTPAKAGYLNVPASLIATQASTATASTASSNILTNVDAALSGLPTSIVASVRTGYISTLGVSVYSEDATFNGRTYYLDTTLSPAVSDVTKCLVLLGGFFTDRQNSIPLYDRVAPPVGYLTSTTNLRTTCFSYQDPGDRVDAHLQATIIEFV